MTSQTEVLKDTNYRPILDHGFVGLVDHMGSDDAIVQAARVSYGKGTKKVSEDRGLIRYLVRHLHTTPLEMVEFKFHCKMPIFVARQWIRHRTANVNEYSGRYSEMTDEFYIPNVENIKPQSMDNKQGRNGELKLKDAESVQEWINGSSQESYAHYQILLASGNYDDGGSFSRAGYGETGEEGFPGIAKELARMVLPLNAYTEWYWKTDLHNLFHFLKLRMDRHTQYETREYANAMFELIKPIVPIACEAFIDYIFDGNTYQNYVISRMERETIIELIEYAFDIASSDVVDRILETAAEKGMSKREIEEFKRKFGLYR